MRRIIQVLIVVLGPLALVPVPNGLFAETPANLEGGYDIPVDELRDLAEQGDATAQYNLGLTYAEGRGVPQDYAQAAAWYRRAAERGDAVAQYILGLMYKDGLGVPQHTILAHMWLNLSSANGHAEAVGLRNSLAELLSPAGLAEAQALARQCLNSNYQSCS